MKSLRFLLAALAALFFGTAIAQVCDVYQYRWQDRQTNTYQWSFQGQEACHKHAQSQAEWTATAYASTYSAANVEGENYTAPTCTYRLRLTYRTTGQSFETGQETVQIMTRCMDCTAGTTKSRHEWAGWLPATDNSPTWQEFYQPNVGSNVTPITRIIDYCYVNLVEPVGFVAAGEAQNGWVPYSMQWQGTMTGSAGTPNDPTFAIPSVPPAPPDNGDPGGDPEDPDGGGGTTTPLQCGQPPDFYAEQYPEGIAGVWEDLKMSFLASSAKVFLDHLIPNYASSTCPTFSITMMDNSTHQIAVPCTVWTFIKACMIITAMFFAVRLIFGGA